MDLDDRIRALQEHPDPTELERDLLTRRAVVVAPHATKNPGVNETLFVVLESGVEAFLKTFAGQRATLARLYGHNRFDVPTHEVTAWRLARACGLPYERMVPTSVLRNINGRSGALTVRMDGSPDAKALREADRQCYAAGFWDVLVGQQDRHFGQFRYDAKTKRLGLIDHGYSFALPGDPVNASEFLAFRRRMKGATISRAERTVLEDLLRSDDLYGLRHYLPEARANAVEQRARRMLRSGLLPLPGQL